MTTPPKVRRFHLSAAESPLAAARAAALGEGAAPAARQSPARPAVRVEIQRRAARGGADASQAPAQPAGFGAAPEKAVPVNVQDAAKGQKRGREEEEEEEENSDAEMEMDVSDDSD